jgi:hypothetical protein
MQHKTHNFRTMITQEAKDVFKWSPPLPYSNPTKIYKDIIPMGPTVNNAKTPYHRHTKFLNGKMQVVLYFSST